MERTAGSTVTVGFPVYDAHGNNVATLSRNGSGGFSLGDRRTYDAWGVVRSQQSGGDPKLRYCANLGHKADDESGLVYMRARYYEPGSGRFVSEDPAGSGGNWYSYCGNDPVNYSDETGKKPYEVKPGHEPAADFYYFMGIISALAAVACWAIAPADNKMAKAAGMALFLGSVAAFDAVLDQTTFNRSPIWDLAKAPAWLSGIVATVAEACAGGSKFASLAGKVFVALTVVYAAAVCGALVGALGDGDQ